VPTFLAQISPQRSTQYVELASQLAPVELRLALFDRQPVELTPVTLAGQAYLRFALPQPPTPAQLTTLGQLATIAAGYELFDQIGEVAGPLLRPLETSFQPALPPDLVMTRRYRGKTNELFTHFLCNVARASSAFADQRWSHLRVLDPLAGGGTTLFTALMLGASAAGIEQDAGDVKSTVTYLQQYLHEARIPARLKEERLRKLGQRWTFAIGPGVGQQCVLVAGETAQTPALLPGYKAHLVVTDLPYGIQHGGPLRELLTRALPAWASLLSPGGVLLFAWDATRFPRSEMVGLVQSLIPLRVLDEPPYTEIVHRVDRVIKLRDVLVVRRGT
jgi:SAM-dependent methyltransferase